MPSPPNITTITPPRVPIVDPTTGYIAREWYRFFLNLFSELNSLKDENAIGISSAQLAQVDAKSVESLQTFAETQPRFEFGTLAIQSADNVLVKTISAQTYKTLDSLNVSHGRIYEDTQYVVANGDLGVVLSYNDTPVAVTQFTGFRPYLDNTYDLGTATQRWMSVYASELVAGASQDATFKEDTGFAVVLGTNGVVTGYGTTAVTVTQFTGFRPFVDNTYDLGTAPQRWNTVYASNGTINTSDGNEKQDISELTEAELRVAAKLKTLVRTFKFRDAVAAKGDKARTHVGVIAQDVQAAFAEEGLDAAKYGMFCQDEWANEDGTTSVRLGVRYGELLAFVIAAL